MERDEMKQYDVIWIRKQGQSWIIRMKPENQNQFLGDPLHNPQPLTPHDSRESLSVKKGISSGKPDVVSIKTVVRVRPFLASESQHNNCLNCVSDNTLEISGGFYHTIRKRVDRVFRPEETQADLYDYLAESISKALEGYNVTIFSYGQTGSGKTYTMFGSDWDTFPQPRNSRQKQHTFHADIDQDFDFAGVIPRCIDHVFNRLVKKKNTSVYCSFLQLYNEKIVDLLGDDSPQPLVIHENKQDGIYVEGLSQHKVKSAAECIGLMQKGEKNRAVRQTSMNMKSSRSHSIFQLLIEQVFPETQTYMRNKINLCDLAGSEKINKAEEIELQHMTELKNINLSLTTLGKVINSLSSSKPLVVCYRQSKLTRLLQDSLGGNTFTTLIANVNAKESCIEETLNTLRFVERARSVVTEVSVRTYGSQPEVKKLQDEISYLKQIIKVKRRSSHVGPASELQTRVLRLEQENKRLKEEQNRGQDSDLMARLIKDNQAMRKQLQQRQNQKQPIDNQKQPRDNQKQPFSRLHTIPHHAFLPKYKKIQSDSESHCNTSHTREKIPTIHSKISTNSKYSNITDFNKKEFSTLPVSQNIIIKRLEKMEELKRNNREKMNRQLRDLEKSEETVIHLRMWDASPGGELAVVNRSRRYSKKQWGERERG